MKRLLAVSLAVLFSLAPLGAMEPPKPRVDPDERGLLESCYEEITIHVAGRERTITLEEAERIKLAVERYLDEEKPKLEPSVFGPGVVFIDCQGTLRMGGWILETAASSEPALSLAYRVFTNESFLVRQVIGLKLIDGEWEVAGVGRVTTHLRR
jgi:hypothetical protein